MRVFSAYLPFVALLLLLPGLPAVEWHVHPVTGSDQSGTGAEASPFRSLTHALGLARPGDVVVAGIGSFDARNGERFPLALGPGVSLLGQGMRDTLILAASPWLPAIQVRLVGGTPWPARLEGLTVLGGATGLAIQLEGQGSTPLLELVELALEDAGQGVLVRDLPGPAGLSAALSLERCLIQGHWGAGLSLAVTRSTLALGAVNCAVLDNGSEGLVAWPVYLGAHVELELLHCTLARNHGAGLRIQSSPTGGSAGCRVANSILWGNRPSDLVGVDPGSVEHCLLGGGSPVGHNGNQTGDPRFLSNRDWRIGHGSAAVGLGRRDLPGLPGQDLDGQSRPLSKAPDAGADEQVLHTLITDPRGARVYRPLSLRVFSYPGASVVWLVSVDTFFPGFSFPGLTGSIQLNFILGMEQLGAAVAGVDGVAHIAPGIFNSTAVLGMRVPIQALGLLSLPGGTFEGGWSNLIVPGLILP